MILKKLFCIVALLGIHTLAKGQNSIATSNEIVKLSRNTYNAKHPYYKLLLKKDNQYIKWLYYHCSGYKKELPPNTPENQPLIFTITNGNSVFIDTIQNCVYPKLYELERPPNWENEIPIYGSLPNNIKLHVKNTLEREVQIELDVKEKNVTANLFILSEKGTLIETLVKGLLNNGNYSFIWDYDTLKNGNYLVYIHIDDSLMIHRIRVNHNWILNLFKLERKKHKAKASISFSGDIIRNENLKEQSIFIHHNRSGTSLGINLTEDVFVGIELLTIEGRKITTITNNYIEKGACFFPLSQHVDEEGVYLIRMSINEKTHYLTTKIKK